MLSFLRSTLLLHGAIDHSLLLFCVSPGTFRFLVLPLGTQIPEFHGLGYDMLLMGCAFINLNSDSLSSLASVSSVSPTKTLANCVKFHDTSFS